MASAIWERNLRLQIQDTAGDAAATVDWKHSRHDFRLLQSIVSSGGLDE